MPNITHTQNGYGFKGTDIVMTYNSTAPAATFGVGWCGKGSSCVAQDTGEDYINVGTKAVPSWKIVTHGA